MKIAIILNGVSKRRQHFYRRVLPIIQENLVCEVLETEYQDHAVVLAEHVQADIVLAAGGDGTLNQVLNGLMKRPEADSPILGVIPLGTGNDFARHCKIKASGTDILKMIQARDFAYTDIGKVMCCDEKGTGQTKYFINVCSVGMSPEVIDVYGRSTKVLGAGWAYLSSIAKVFFWRKPKWISVNTKNWHNEGSSRIIAIANGSTFARSICIDLDNQVDDGEFTTFLAGKLSTYAFLRVLAAVSLGKKSNHPQVQYKRAKTFELKGEHQMIEAEGEIQGFLPATVEVVPQGIQFLRRKRQ